MLTAHIPGVLRVIDIILDKEPPEPTDEAATDGSKADRWSVLPTGGTVTDRCAQCTDPAHDCSAPQVGARDCTAWNYVYSRRSRQCRCCHPTDPLLIECCILATSGRIVLVQRASQRIIARLRRDLFGAILKMKISFFDKRTTGIPFAV